MSNKKRTEEDNSRTTGAVVGGALLGASLGGPVGAMVGGFLGALLGESVNDKNRKDSLLNEPEQTDSAEDKPHG